MGPVASTRVSLGALIELTRRSMIDWLVKHGRITPETDSRYAELCAALHRPLVCPLPSYAQ